MLLHWFEERRERRTGGLKDTLEWRGRLFVLPVCLFALLTSGLIAIAASLTSLSPAAIVPVIPLLFDRLFDAVLHLLADRLQGLVYLVFHFLLREPERLLHLLAHRVGDLPLQITEDGLNGLPNLILQCLAQSLRVALVGFLTVVALIGAIVVPLAPRLLLPAVLLTFRATAALLSVGLRLPLPVLALCPLILVRSSCPSRLFDGHNISLPRLT